MKIINCPCCHKLVDESHNPIDPKYCTSCEELGKEDAIHLKFEIWQAQLCRVCYLKFFPTGEVDVQAFFEHLSQ